MKRSRTITREFIATQSRIATLREEHARIGEEISNLQAAQHAQAAKLVTDVLGTLDLTGVPIDSLLSAIVKVGGVAPEAPSMPPSAAVPAVNVLVRISRNASPANRALLEEAGLHWNGRDGVWLGNVTHDELDRLRAAFGERVEQPESGGAVEESGTEEIAGSGAL
jgi:hypothetical protein